MSIHIANALYYQKEIEETLRSNPKGYKKEISDNVTLILEIMQKQQYMISKLEGKLEILPETKPTYAETARRAEKGKVIEATEMTDKKQRKKPSKFALTIHPNGELSSKETKTIIQRGIILAKVLF